MSSGIRAICEITCTRSSAPYFPPAIDLRSHRGGIEPSDDLVGELQVAHVARGHLQCRLDRLVLDPHRIVAFKPRPQAVENRPRFLDRRLARPAPVRNRRASASSSWMNSLYSLSVVAPMIRTSPRASTDLKMFAASDGAPRAEPAPIIVWTSSMNRIRFGRSLISRMTFWIRSSNMPRSIVPATIVFICRLTIWQSRRRTGTFSGSNSMRRAIPSAIAVLPTPGSPSSRTEFARSRWQRISRTRSISCVATEDRRELVLARQLIQVGGEVLEERWELETLLESFLPQLVIAHPCGQPGDKRLRLDAVSPDDRDRDPLRLFEYRRKQIRGFNRVAAAAARVQQGQLEQQLRRGGNPKVASRHARQQPQVLLERLKDLVRVELEVTHDLTEHVPFDLREGQTDVLIRQQRVLAAARLLERAIHDTLGRLCHLVLRDIEIVHGLLQPCAGCCGRWSKKTPNTTPAG